MKQKNTLHKGTGISGKVSYVCQSQVSVHNMLQICKHDVTCLARCSQYEQVTTKINSTLINAAQVALKSPTFTIQLCSHWRLASVVNKALDHKRFAKSKWRSIKLRLLKFEHFSQCST